MFSSRGAAVNEALADAANGVVLTGQRAVQLTVEGASAMNALHGTWTER